MKNSTCFRRDTASNLYEDLMFPLGAHGCFERVKLEGRNAGAALITRGGSSGAIEDCCSINIYISNNVQGVNNSILVGSDVKLGDPGVSLSFQGLKLDKGFQKSSKKNGSDFSLGMCLMLLFVLITTSLFFTLT